MLEPTTYPALRQTGFDREDCCKIMHEMRDDSDDFEVANHRFIKADGIDQIMQDELSSDTYTLGCFAPWFIADILDISTDAVEKIQKANAYDAYDGLGEMMLPHIAKVQAEYASADGYGHHFNHYDGNEDEIGQYYVFRVN